MRFITKQIHSYLDYPVALALLILPYVLNLGGSSAIAFYLSISVGVAALALTLVTDHQTGVFPILSYRFHLTIDFLVALLFLAAPFIFSFKGVDAYFYWINGAAILLVVTLHKPEKVTFSNG